MEEKLDIITIGESLIELSSKESLKDADTLDKYYGGDTLTTAISALKLGSKVGFISRIGMDCFKNYLMESWQEAGLDISQVKPVQGVNGLYMISRNLESKEKEFALYRKKTAATNLSIDDISPAYIKNASILYSTGITQSLSISAREAVKQAFEIAKENNVLTAYDPNFSPLIWSDAEAKEAFDEIKNYIDILFINVKRDSRLIVEFSTVDNIIKHLWDYGISTIIVKSCDEKKYYVGHNGTVEIVDFPQQEIIDDTGAGDAFNGGVLHALACQMPIYKAVTLGAIVASLQITGVGAIKSIPARADVYKILKGNND